MKRATEGEEQDVILEIIFYLHCKSNVVAYVYVSMHIYTGCH